MLFSWFLSDTGNARKHFEAVQCGSMGITTTEVERGISRAYDYVLVVLHLEDAV